MLLSIVLVAATIAAVPPTSAKPATGLTYLECDAMRRGQRVHYSITLNEQAGIADWSSPTVRRRDRAQFTADAVYFQYFKLNRLNLMLVRQYPTVLGDSVETETGTCKVASDRGRAF